MPSQTLPPVEPYTPAPPPTEQLDYADLPVVDLSKASTPEGRAELAPVARDAMRTTGFMYAINHGYTPAQTKRIFDIANVPFEHVSHEEKRLYAGNIKATGQYFGYKLRNYWHINNGVRDQIEHYNLSPEIYRRQHPGALRPLLPEIEAFVKHCYSNVFTPILRLLAIGLEIPEETLLNLHKEQLQQESFVRFMKYYPRSAEEEEKTNNVWLKGHTDPNSLTILWSQPVAALQILSPGGQWKWIRHIDNALVINIGDAMEFLSGGFYKATIHRVVQPPPSQRGYARVGAFYFGMAEEDVVLAPLEEESQAIRRSGVKLDRLVRGQEPTQGQYRKARISNFGQSEHKKGENGVDTEVLSGVLVKHYN